ncbi:MAG: hypothetical protein HYW26_05560 [Candidatus Aenigmarchaeota archaeon]|nr:hypothetical protein [Candidatus Aenigmarchaeota archaeon]
MRQEKSDEELKAWILYKLAKHGYFHGRHTDFENISKGFKPQHLGKSGHKRIGRLADELAREGFIIKKPTSYGLHVSLNSTKSQEMKEFIKRVLHIEL